MSDRPRPGQSALPLDWHRIEQCLDSLTPVDGGFSSARRGLLTLPGGSDVFVKIGLHDSTKRWAAKEIGVYRVLERHHYPHSPRLLATNADETAFALDACAAATGWDWQDTWDGDRLAATLQAMDDLASIHLDDNERAFFSERNLSQDDNGWLPLLASEEKQDVLARKLRSAGVAGTAAGLDLAREAERSARYVFADDTLVHYDVRADNCGWNASLRQVRLVDWNWTQLGDRDIDRAATLTHVQKSGFDLPPDVRRTLHPDALHWMAGFWFNAAATPIWEGGPAHLRDMQLLAGVTALRLARHASSGE